MTTRIERQLWIKNITDTLEVFASEEFQTRVWIKGSGPEVSSFVEAVCQLSDYQLDLLVDTEWRQIGLTKIQHDKLAAFRDAIDKFNDVVPEFPNDLDVLSHPDWPQIRQLAQSALDVFAAV